MVWRNVLGAGSGQCRVDTKLFSNHLRNLIRASRGRTNPSTQPWRLTNHYPIGLAISGGVDSMGLAVLAARCEALPDPIKFRAFVVDHAAREGSDNEAREVAKTVESLGIPTSVLKIDWPETVNTGSVTNFESLARKYRFQALGRACRDWGIRYLCMAHHQEDAAETILMRMIDGHRGIGLTGIKPESNLPECQGMHGISESGRIDLGNRFELPKHPSYDSPIDFRTDQASVGERDNQSSAAGQDDSILSSKHDTQEPSNNLADNDAVARAIMARLRAIRLKQEPRHETGNSGTLSAKNRTQESQPAKASFVSLQQKSAPTRNTTPSSGVDSKEAPPKHTTTTAISSLKNRANQRLLEAATLTSSREASPNISDIAFLEATNKTHLNEPVVTGRPVPSSTRTDSSHQLQNETYRFEDWQPMLEDGGVVLLRPCLVLTKSHLRATCEEAQMKWFEDSTNHDPTFTKRNAVRHLFANYQLPKALQQERLLRLAAVIRTRARYLEVMAVKQILDHLALKLDSRTGILRIRFHKSSVLSSSDTFNPAKGTMVQQRQIADMVLGALINCVSGKEQIDLRAMVAAREYMVPQLARPEGLKPTEKGHRLVVASVMIKKVDTAVRSREQGATIKHDSNFPPFSDGMETHGWVISQQPPYLKAEKCMTWQPSVKHLSKTVFEALRVFHDQWRLFQGRFWIRLTNNTTKELILRCMVPTDLQKLRKSMPQNMFSAFERLKAQIAPGDLYRSLPIIVTREIEGGEETEVPLCLPTLRLYVPGAEDKFKVNIRYRKPHQWVRRKFKQEGLYDKYK